MAYHLLLQRVYSSREVAELLSLKCHICRNFAPQRDEKCSRKCSLGISQFTQIANLSPFLLTDTIEERRRNVQGTQTEPCRADQN